jgi:hypothetical protein
VKVGDRVMYLPRQVPGVVAKLGQRRTRGGRVRPFIVVTLDGPHPINVCGQRVTSVTVGPTQVMTLDEWRERFA